MRNAHCDGTRILWRQPRPPCYPPARPAHGWKRQTVGRRDDNLRVGFPHATSSEPRRNVNRFEAHAGSRVRRHRNGLTKWPPLTAERDARDARAAQTARRSDGPLDRPGPETLPDLAQRTSTGSSTPASVLSTCPTSAERRPIIACMISAVNAFPREARTSEETRKNRASVSNMRPSRSKTTAQAFIRISVHAGSPETIVLARDCRSHRTESAEIPSVNAQLRVCFDLGHKGRRDPERRDFESIGNQYHPGSGRVPIRQQVSRLAEITSRSVGNARETRARVRKLLVILLTTIGVGSMPHQSLRRQIRKADPERIAADSPVRRPAQPAA